MGRREGGDAVKEQQFYDYESRLARPTNVKISELQSGERLKHVIFADQLTKAVLERLARTADRIRTIDKLPSGKRFLRDLLPHVKAMLYFTQPSTRTFLSFMSACQTLGISCSEVRDTRVSSESKGESPFDSMRMFSSYFDVVIVRSNVPQFAECCAYMMNDLNESSRRGVPIINGGSGADEHPTQALLDMYTIQRALSFTHSRDSSHWTWFDELRQSYPGLRKGINGKTVGFCGDIRRGRTVRSLARLLTLYDDISMYFVSPPVPKLKLPQEVRAALIGRGADVREFNTFEDPVGDSTVIKSLDVLYMTRIQREHNSAEDDAEFGEVDFTPYRLTPKLVSQMKSYSAILHPFPRDEEFGEIPTTIDADPRAYYFRQARNGMWVRAALLAYLFDVDSTIAEYYEDFMSERKDYNEGVL